MERRDLSSDSRSANKSSSGDNAKEGDTLNPILLKLAGVDASESELATTINMFPPLEEPPEMQARPPEIVENNAPSISETGPNVSENGSSVNANPLEKDERVDSNPNEGNEAEKIEVPHPSIENTNSKQAKKEPEIVQFSLEQPASTSPSQSVLLTKKEDQDREAPNVTNEDKKIKIDSNTKKSLAHWPTSRSQTAHSRYSPKIQLQNSLVGDRPPTNDLSVDLEKIPRLQRPDGKYEEIPNVMDGFRMLNRGVSREPDHVYSLSLVGENLIYVIEDDLTLFTNLINLNVSENNLPFARLGVLPAMKKLVMSCNNVQSLDLEVEGRFTNLEYLDLSFNAIDHAAQLVLSTLPKLSYLDLSSNHITSLCDKITNLDRWQEKVIELLLPSHVAALDAHLMKQVEVLATEEDKGTMSANPIANESAQNQAEKKPTMEQVIEENVDNKSQTLGLSVPLTHDKSHPEDDGNLSDHGSKDDDGGHANTVASETSEMIIKPEEKDIDTPMINDTALQNANTGFRCLDTLILENNRLGSSGSPSFWQILSQMPSLRILNLNGNRIHTLRPLIPGLGNQIQEPIDLLSINPQVLRKYDGFYKLNELYLCQNKIPVFDDLIGIICLPQLRHVYLEGNPVMKEFVPKHLRRKLPTPDDIDIFRLFSRSYGLVISDLCYQPPRSYLNDSRVIAINSKKLSGGIRVVDREKLLKAELQNNNGSARVFKKNGRLSHHIIPHMVQQVPLGPPKELVQDRQKRRHYDFTEEDLKQIVKEGRIPPVSELMLLAERREKQTMGETMDVINEEEKQPESFHDPAAVNDNPLDLESDPGEPITESMEKLFYDPSRMDETFLTGVHITGKDMGSDSEEESQQYEDDESDGSETSFSEGQSRDSSSQPQRDSPSRFDEDDPAEIEEADGIVYPLPKNIQASVRALRHALSNPVSYWRMMEESYARPTFASIQKEEHAAWTKKVMSEKQASDISSNSDVSELLRDIIAGDDVSSESSTARVTGLNTPANSIWTPTHGAPEGTMPLDPLSIPEFTKKKKRFAQGSVTYRTKDDILLTSQLNDKELHRELNIRLQMNLSPTIKGLMEEKGVPSQPKEQLPKLKGRINQKLGAAAALQRAHRDGRLRAKDEFDEMNDIMLTVDKKINTIEANLAHVLKNNSLRKHLPKSRQLFDELQKEYERIENMYLADAKAVIQSEPLSQRLVKLGVAGSTAK